ncbi:hypothetical protein [Clostridium felsineum]|uniref:Uncharacterized protein n=1 Tax=Clostridium felsineum TaxID=36839 RepID=A0A1S8MDF1_9CLOT|nr:hypothetical protein [Clostridium felsineum]URZ00934.1 hypothetical protein CLAUR_009220 [Clostridium felsineum]URZ06320.1 hypothetical protein CLROS_016530 [Clostridium felsineum]URZ11355.1 hypothetical protein CROST_020720 [Clostridium felsineum]
MVEKLIYRLKNKKLLSLDVFDTLLFRAVKDPCEIFTITAKELLKNENLDFELSEEEFKIMRIEAEKNARIKKKKILDTDEVFLEEIYNEFPESIIKNKKEAVRTEVEIETKYCYVNSEIIKLIDYAYDNKINIILTSDMYLKEEDLRYIFYKNEFSLKKIDNIFMSSEYGVSKRNEGLFKIIFNEYKNIEKNEMLHIGDNRISDVTVPHKLGMDSFFYDVVHENGNKVFEYEKILYNYPLKALDSLRKLACYDFKQDYELQIGILVLGPFLTVYIDWVVNKLQKYNIKAIYPLMREGTLLAKLLKNEIERRKLKIKVNPIYVSRKSTYIPSILEYNEEEVEKLFLTNWKLCDLARNFNLNSLLEVFGEFSEVYLKKASEVNFKEGSLYDALKKFLLSEDIRNEVKKYISKKRKALNMYLRQEMEGFEEVATIDVGFSGTIQSAIENSLKGENIQFKLYHFLAMSDENVKNKLFDKINILGFCSSFKENEDLIKNIKRNTFILEQLILDSVGTTLDYKLTENKVLPVLKDTNFNISEKEKKWWKGVIIFQKRWMDLVSKKPLLCKNIIENKREILQIISRLVNMPTPVEVEVIGNLTFEDKFGLNVERKICTDKDVDLVKKYGEDYIDKNGFKGFDEFNILWYEGVITKANPNYYVKKYLEDKSNDEYFNAARKVIEKVKNYGLDEVVVYGAGKVGEAVIKACSFYSVKILNIVDRNESLWGKSIEDIKIISLKDSLKLGYKNYIVASFSFIEEIRKTILDKAKDIGESNIEIFYFK